ncbi:MAG: carboxypeptidase regulatory-like domain-containing protein, partial [Planctomycetota bacterium]
MNRKRVSYFLLIAVALVAGLAFFLYLEGGSSREGRGRAAEGRSAAGDAGPSADGRATGDAFADATALRELVAKHGGFHTKGRVLLTRPAGPGADLDVRLRGRVDGTPVEVAGRTDADGAFFLPQLPREGDFTLAVDGARIQAWQRFDIAAPDEGALDLGELVLRRVYLLKGRVLGEGRRGLAGARVALLAGAGANFSFFQAGMQAEVDDPVLAQAEVDDRGRFTLELARPGIFTVRARAEGWAPQYRANLVVGGVADTEVTLALTRGYEVVGYVLDGAGRPVADTSVALFAMSRRSFSWSKELSRTDGTGRFDFVVEPRATEYTVSATLKQSLNLAKQFRVPLEADLILQLPGHGVLTGRVLNASTQQPVAGAAVLLGLARSAQLGFGMPEFGKALHTDAFGVFRVEGVGPGRFQSLTVRADGFADVRLGAFMATDPELWKRVQAIELDGAGETRLPDLALEGGRTLVGVVRRKDTGGAIAGATVELWDFFMGNRSTETDTDGGYRFSGVGDRLSMIVSKPGYAPFRESPFPGFPLPEGKSVTRDFALEQGGTVRGKVTTADGAPVARALVRLRAAAVGWSSWTVAISLRDAWTYTDEDGRYSLTGVAVAKIYAEAEAPGFDSCRSKEKQVKAGAEVKQLDITMLPAARLAGRVV